LAKVRNLSIVERFDGRGRMAPGANGDGTRGRRYQPRGCPPTRVSAHRSGSRRPVRLRPRHGREDPAATRRSIILAIAAAAAFSIGLITSARLGDVPISWILLTSRAVGVVLIAVPLAARGRLRLPRRALPLVVVSGVLEALGSALYVTGAHASPAMAAVLSSQFAAIAVLSAFILFGERLARVQFAGITLVGVGVTALAIVRA